MLRIHDRGLLRAEPEELGVKLVKRIQDDARLDVTRVTDKPRGHAGRRELIVAQVAHGAAFVYEVSPERAYRRRVWEARAHSDDCDVVFQGGGDSRVDGASTLRVARL